MGDKFFKVRARRDSLIVSAKTGAVAEIGDFNRPLPQFTGNLTRPFLLRLTAASSTGDLTSHSPRLEKFLQSSLIAAVLGKHDIHLLPTPDNYQVASSSVYAISPIASCTPRRAIRP